MPQLIPENKTIVDLLEAAAEHRAYPARRAYHSQDTVAVALSKSDWIQLVTLKNMDYKGLGEHIIIEDNNVARATYKNIALYYSGQESSNNSIDSYLDVLQLLPENHEEDAPISRRDQINMVGAALGGSPARYYEPIPVSTSDWSRNATTFVTGNF